VRAVAVRSSVRGRNCLAAPTAGVANRVGTVRRSLPGGDGARAPCRLVLEHDVCRVCRGTALAAVDLPAPLEKLLESARRPSHHLRSRLGSDLDVGHTV